MKPTLRRENKLWQQGHKLIAGLDEVGKGAWAGPLVAVAVILPKGFKLSGIRDSKQLTPQARAERFVELTRKAVQYAVGVVSNKLIDKIGIQQANARAFRLAVRKLSVRPDYLLIDGLEIAPHPISYEYLVDGDEYITSIAAASIIAKVTRDQIMEQFDRRYPEYGFAAHKGYGTLEHAKAIDAAGPSPIHRLSFSPLKGIKKIS